MMKLILFLFSIGTFVPCFGQKWHLNKVDHNQDYPFEYWFQFEHLDDTSTYKLTKQSGKQHSNLPAAGTAIKLFDNRGDTLMFESITVVNINTQEEIKLFSDVEGMATVALKTGTYRISVRSAKYDDFTQEFDIENDEQLELVIHLGLAPDIEVYQIDSKKELKEAEVLEIIECVRENPREFHSCSRMKYYNVIMHI